MKKHFLIAASFACTLLAASAGLAAHLSPYEYNPKNPPVEVDLSVLDAMEAPQQQPSNAAPAEIAEAPRPTALTPPADAAPPVPLASENVEAAASTPAGSTETFLDKIMANHLPPGTEKKVVKPRPAVTPPAPVRKPAMPVAEAPKAEEKPVEAAPAAVEAPKTAEKPAVVPAPVAVETPQTEEQPQAVDAKSSEERPAGPVVRERRRRSAPEAEAAPAPAPALDQAPEAVLAPAPAPADMSIAFGQDSSELSSAAQESLNAFVAKVMDMPGQRIQIRAYASDSDSSGSTARRMALSRALMVRSYLAEKGIDPSRLDVRPLGAESNKPADQVELVLVK